MKKPSTNWDQVYQERDFPVFNDILLQKLFKRYKFSGDGLDIGCGTGDLAGRLSTLGLQMTGIDLSDVAIEKAKEKSPGVKFIVSDVFDHKGSYDLVIAKLVLALVDDKAGFLQKSRELMKPGGFFLLNSPIRYTGNNYDQRYVSISMEEGQLMKLVSDHFSDAEVFHEDYTFFNYASRFLVCRL